MSNQRNDKINVNELVEKAKSSKNLGTNEGLNDFINKVNTVFLSSEDIRIITW